MHTYILPHAQRARKPCSTRAETTLNLPGGDAQPDAEYSNIYLFISLLTAGLVGLLYLHDERGETRDSKIEKLFVKMGDNSYVLYLFHWPILVVLRRFFGNWALQFIAVFIASVLAAMVFNWFNTKLMKMKMGGK